MHTGLRFAAVHTHGTDERYRTSGSVEDTQKLQGNNLTKQILKADQAESPLL